MVRPSPSAMELELYPSLDIPQQKLENTEIKLSIHISLHWYYVVTPPLWYNWRKIAVPAADWLDLCLGGNIIHGWWFLAPVRRHRKISSWPQYALYTSSCWFLFYGMFSGVEELSSSVRTVSIANPTSYSPKTSKISISTTSSAIYYFSSASTCSSKGPSLKNRCLVPSVVIQ